jgi:hypothetical protein
MHAGPMPGLQVRPGGQAGSFGQSKPDCIPQNVAHRHDGWLPRKTKMQLSVTRGQLVPHVDWDVSVQIALVDTQPQVLESIAAQVSPAGHGPPQKPDASGAPQTDMVDEVTLDEVVTVVLLVLVVLVLGGAAGAQRSREAPGATVWLPNWSTIGTGACVARGQRSA